MSPQAEEPAVLRVLGPTGIWVGGEALPIGGAKPRRLLAALAVHRNTVVSTDRLMDVLWADEVPESGPATLQAYVSRLRRLLPSPLELVTEAPGYRLVAAPGATDVDRFETQLSAGLEALAETPGQARQLLEDALAEWSGEALAEFAEEPWALPEATRLSELRLHAREEHLDVLLALGLEEQAISEAQALVAGQPWRERPWRTLMLGLHRVGRQGDALAAANDYRGRLREERGLAPSQDFVALEGRILADEGQPAAPIVPAAGGTAGQPPPPPAIDLVGRDGDIARIRELCARHRVVTLLGPGGIGKTQLARQVAATAAANSAVTQVELAPVRDQVSVVAAIATQLGVQAQQGRSVLESVVDLLASRQHPLLLVLDNCEHVLDAVATFVERLVAACPTVTVLATSRVALGLPLECVDRVPALLVPDRDAAPDAARTFPAVDLFLRRARSANADLVVDDAAVSAVTELCRRLDGMPLAIELAAARTRALSPAEINERLDDRFALLTGASRVADERHRSLRTLVDWSYQLLEPAEQELFRRLCTFAGAFDLAAAEQVCGDGPGPSTTVASVLASLVDKSMVHASAGARTTYRLLETLREYGTVLGPDEVPELQSRHRAWLVELCERGASGVGGADEAEWLDTFDRVFDDMRLVVSRALGEGDARTAMRIVVAGREHAFRRLRYELIGWAEVGVVSRGRVPDEPLGAATLAIVAYGRFVRGESDAAIDLARRALAEAEEHGTDTLGLAERTLANACFFQGDMPGTHLAMAGLVGSALGSGDDARITHAYYMRSLGETRDGAANPGIRDAELAIEAAARSASPTAQAQAAYAAGIWSTASDPARARRELERSESLAREVGNRWFELFARTETLWLQALDGGALTALASYAEVLEAWHRAGDWANQWLSLRHVLGICSLLGADELALVIHGALERAGAVDAFPFEPGAAAELARTADALRVRLGDRSMALELQGRTASTSAVISTVVEQIRSLTEGSTHSTAGSGRQHP